MDWIAELRRRARRTLMKPAGSHRCRHGWSFPPGRDAVGSRRTCSSRPPSAVDCKSSKAATLQTGILAWRFGSADQGRCLSRPAEEQSYSCRSRGSNEVALAACNRSACCKRGCRLNDRRTGADSGREPPTSVAKPAATAQFGKNRILFNKNPSILPARPEASERGELCSPSRGT